MVTNKNSCVYMQHRWDYVTEKTANQIHGSGDRRWHTLRMSGTCGCCLFMNDDAILTANNCLAFISRLLIIHTNNMLMWRLNEILHIPHWNIFDNVSNEK